MVTEPGGDDGVVTPDATAVIDGVDIDHDEPGGRRRPRARRRRTPPPPLALVVFGASGDLASRKLLPAIAALAEHGALPDGFTVVGVARTAWSDDQFRQAALDGRADRRARLARTSSSASATWPASTPRSRTFDQLKEVLDRGRREARHRRQPRLLPGHHPVDCSAPWPRALAEHGLQRPGRGRDLRPASWWRSPSAATSRAPGPSTPPLHGAFDEDQIFRIDHYLGKETVQNVLALRFANAIFEPIWNRRYVDHIQITVAEELGVEHRGGFYETAGALRDIVQNHVMQVLALTLMEPPATVDAQGIRDEKVKLLRAVVDPRRRRGGRSTSVRGQYTAGTIDGEPVVGYREEDGVDPHSRTETYVAMHLAVDNWRWAGVPVYIRTGKRLPKRATEVTLQFHRVPHLAFGSQLTRDLRPNMLHPAHPARRGDLPALRGQGPRARPSGSARWRWTSATPRPSRAPTADGYERLLHDAMIGDATLFIRTDEVEQAWRIVDPFLEAWSEDGVPLAQYPAGTWGPKEADSLLARDLRQWHEP